MGDIVKAGTSRVSKWRRARWAAVLVGFVASAGMVWQASYAAFSAQTDNTGNSWSSGTVVLSDDDSGAVLFSASNMKPGDSSTKCIQVTYTGTLAANVKLYGAVTAGSPDLSPYIKLKVEQGTGGTFADCTGFSPNGTTPTLFDGTLGGASSFAAATDWTSGILSTFAPTGASTESYTYRVTATLDSNAPNSVQGGSAQANFIWEAQNT
jgi:hypothetical protein